MRIPSQLKARVQKYAKEHHTDIADLVTRFFVRLVEEEDQRKLVDAEQV